MTREEEIARASNDYHLKRLPNFTFGGYVAFIDGAQWADQHPHWISVDEELPPLEQEVLICEKDGILGCNTFLVDARQKDYYNNSNTNNGWEWRSELDPTHWMPLPEAPSSSEFPNNHIIDANKKVDRVIGTADHIKTALDVLNKKGGENENP